MLRDALFFRKPKKRKKTAPKKTAGTKSSRKKSTKKKRALRGFDYYQAFYDRIYDERERERKSLGIPETFLYRGHHYKVMDGFRDRREALEDARLWREEEKSPATVKVFTTRIGKVYVWGVLVRR